MCSIKSTSKGLTRRNFVTGAAAAAVAGSTGLASMAHGAVKTEGKTVTPTEQMNTYGQDLLNMLVLRT